MDTDSRHDPVATDIDSYKKRIFGDAPFTYVDIHDREAADLATQRWPLLAALRPARQIMKTRTNTDAVS